MSPRIYEHAFDWDEAARMRSEGTSYGAISRHFGVSITAVRRVLIPSVRAKLDENAKRYQRENRPWVGECTDCGAPATRVRSDPAARGRCMECFRKAAATSVREDTLRCGHCREWLPDGAFPSQHRRRMRRGRHGICRACQNVVRRAYRLAHPGADAARQRARRRKRVAS